MRQNPLPDAVEKFGQSGFARLVGTSQQNVRNWYLARKPLPAEFVLKAEAETGIPRHEWRPDLYPHEQSAAA